MPRLTAAMTVDVVSEVLSSKRTNLQQIEAGTALSDLQLDSLDVAEVFMALEDRCGLELDPDSARSLETVGDLARMRAVDDS